MKIDLYDTRLIITSEIEKFAEAEARARQRLDAGALAVAVADNLGRAMGAQMALFEVLRRLDEYSAAKANTRKKN